MKNFFRNLLCKLAIKHVAGTTAANCVKVFSTDKFEVKFCNDHAFSSVSIQISLK